MRTSCSALMLAIAVSLCSCHSGGSNASAPVAPSGSTGNSAASGATNSTPSSAGAATGQTASLGNAPHLAKRPEVLDQLSLDVEGGTRDGSYALWVHVTHDGKPVKNAVVGAVDANHKLACPAAYTDDKGDARLLVAAGDYKLVAKRHKWHAEESVTFARGKDFMLEVK